MSRTVIVGSSVGGVRTAQSLRSEGYEGDIVLVGEEQELPYDKPPLSKGLLVGTATAESVRLLTQEAAERDCIQLLLGYRATRLDVAAHRVELEGLDPLSYDQVVIATGARARPSPWGERSGIHVMRTLQDAQLLRQDLMAGGHVVVVGGGFIGAEVASSARMLGLEVTMVDPLPVPMSRVFNPEIGKWFAALHERHGVRSLFDVGVETIDGERGDFTVRLTDGSSVSASVVVIGIGAEPNDAWLKSSGLVVDNGLVCDEYCRAVDVHNVYGVGDVARWFHPTYRTEIRVEHWTNAVDQAVCVAHNIVHPDDARSYAPLEYVWSDQHDWKIQVVGRTAGGSIEHVMIGDPAADNRFAVLYTPDGTTMSGAAVVNWPRALVLCRKGLRDGTTLNEVRQSISVAAAKQL
ncbi:MAG: NAD(P)/FAD-dependent oxidoreductase [Solirubrobacterales bacterium]